MAVPSISVICSPDTTLKDHSSSGLQSGKKDGTPLSLVIFRRSEPSAFITKTSKALVSPSLFESKASWLPSGDQVGKRCSIRLFRTSVRQLTFEPSASATQISQETSLSRLLWNAIRLPSGDQDGFLKNISSSSNRTDRPV